MKNDALIQKEGMEILMKELGLVEAERFIMLIRQERFDYTLWQKDLFAEKSLETIFKEAAALRARTEKKERASARSRQTKTTGKTVKKTAGGRKTAGGGKVAARLVPA